CQSPWAPGDDDSDGCARGVCPGRFIASGSRRETAGIPHFPGPFGLERARRGPSGSCDNSRAVPPHQIERSLLDDPAVRPVGPGIDLTIFIVLGVRLPFLTWGSRRRGRWFATRLLGALTLLPPVWVAFPRILGPAGFLLTFGAAMQLLPVLERHAAGF